MLAARELRRGTLKLLSELEPFRHLGIPPPSLRLLLNQVNAIRIDTRMITLITSLSFNARFHACDCVALKMGTARRPHKLSSSTELRRCDNA